MRIYIDLFVHKVIFRNTGTLITLLVASFLIPTILYFSNLAIIINEKPHGIIALISYFLVVLNIILISHVIYSFPNLKKNLPFVKFSNCTVGVFKKIKNEHRKIFHNYIILSILKKDFDSKKILHQYDNPSKALSYLIKELTAKQFKQRILNELNWPRFYQEVSCMEQQNSWVRDIICYKTPYQRALTVTLTTINDGVIMNSLEEIKLALLDNFVISENGIELDSKSLKKSIRTINEGNKINLQSRIILNPLISQKQFAQIIEKFTSQSDSNIDSRQFTAGFTGFAEFNSSNYNLNLPLYAIPMRLDKSDALEFISLLVYLRKREVILSNKLVNSESKMGKIAYLFWENTESKQDTLRKYFSETYQYRTKLGKSIRYDVNTIISKYLPN